MAFNVGPSVISNTIDGPLPGRVQATTGCHTCDGIRYNPSKVMDSTDRAVGLSVVSRHSVLPMEVTRKMPASVKRIRFADSQNECEVVLPQTVPSDFLLFLIKIIVPILHNSHWSLYAINSDHKRVDIMDSNNYQLIRIAFNNHHGALSKRIVKRFIDALQTVVSKSFCRFGGFSKNFMDCPKMQICSSDYAFFVMRFMEAFDGNKEPIESLYILVTSYTFHSHFGAKPHRCYPNS
uniref:Ubiquitin-like protease family profile domain-containing protein n=1 Tax=Oryza brachyantha TaxID=4533 RepID=J3N7J6_ORYBR